MVDEVRIKKGRREKRMKEREGKEKVRKASSLLDLGLRPWFAEVMTMVATD